MKRAFLVSLVALGVGVNAFASEDRSLSFGIQGGPSFSSSSVSPSTSNAVTGITAGVKVETALIPGVLYLQPELNFNQLGAENSALGSLASTRLNYLELPVQLKAKVNISGVKPFVIAGPKLGYLLSAAAETNLGGGSQSIATTGRFSPFNLSVDFGAGAAFTVAENTDLTLTAKYSQGLTDIDKTAYNWKTQGLEVLIGMLF